jgi:hypothetical protein
MNNKISLTAIFISLFLMNVVPKKYCKNSEFDIDETIQT